MQCRLDDIEYFVARHPRVPDVEKAAASRDWRWRFFAALHHAVTDDNHEGLISCLARTRRQDRKSAAAIAAACWLLGEERFEEAADLLTAVGQDAGPIDHAWVLTQLARVKFETGKIEEARQNAVDALRSIAGALGSSDATASAIRAAAAALLYYTADDRENDFSGMLSATDHAVSWWRNQVQSSALEKSLEESFLRVVHDSSQRWGHKEAAHNRLYSTVITSSFSGEHGAWLNALRLLSMNLVSSQVETDSPTQEAILGLRVAGARTDLKKLLEDTWKWGPTESITNALTVASQREWSHTSASSTLVLMEHAGDLATERDADQIVERLLGILSDPTAFASRVNPSFSVPIYVLDAVKGVVGSCSRRWQNKVLAFLSESPNLVDAQWYRRVLNRVRRDYINVDVADQLYRRALETSEQGFSAGLLGLAADAGHSVAADELLNRARLGDYYALGAFGDVRQLSQEDAALIAAKDAERLRQMMAEAEKSSYAAYVHDSAHGMALLGGWFPNSIDWELLVEFIRHPQVAGEHKRGCCLVLAHLSDKLPPGVREAIVAVLPDMSSASLDLIFGQSLGGAGIYLAASLGAYDDEQLATEVVNLLAASSAHRADAALMIGNLGISRLIPISVGLVGDADPNVRLAATTSLAGHVARTGDNAEHIALESLRNLSVAPGCALALRVVNAFQSSMVAESAARVELMQGYIRHPSALVRQRAELALTARRSS